MQTDEEAFVIFMETRVEFRTSGHLVNVKLQPPCENFRILSVFQDGGHVRYLTQGQSQNQVSKFLSRKSWLSQDSVVANPNPTLGLITDRWISYIPSNPNPTLGLIIDRWISYIPSNPNPTLGLIIDRWIFYIPFEENLTTFTAFVCRFRLARNSTFGFPSFWQVTDQSYKKHEKQRWFSLCHWKLMNPDFKIPWYQCPHPR